MSKRILVVSIVMIFSVNGFSQGENFSRYLKVDFTKVGESSADTLYFTGTVKSIYECPQCPPRAQCKPCIGDHVVVTNGDQQFDFRVFTHRLSLFEVDGVYHFLVRFRSEVHRITNVELVTATKK